MKVEVELPQINPIKKKDDSPKQNGVKRNNANQLPQPQNQNNSRNNSNQLKLNCHSNKHLHSKQTKGNSKFNLKSNFQVLGHKHQLNLSSNTNISLNANSKSFSIGLQQNLKSAITLLFQVSTPNVQNALKDFTSQQVISSLLLSGGISTELQNNSELHNKTVKTFIDTPLFKQLLTTLSLTIPSGHPITNLQNLWGDCGGIFSDSGCSQTGKDLEIVALKYAKILASGDLQTLVKLTEVIQKGQDKPENVDTKLNELLKQIISKGEKVAVKQAQTANMSYPKNGKVVASYSLNKELIVDKQQIQQPKSQNAQNVVLDDKLLFNVKEKTAIVEFYTEKTETALRKQLDYYPHYAYDQQISAFANPDEAHFGKDEFLENYYDEIETWLESGKHRFVKDFEFDKPLGMIVDRGESEFITADKVRVVLVRDGSVDGWHFMRSFLVS